MGRLTKGARAAPVLAMIGLIGLMIRNAAAAQAAPSLLTGLPPIDSDGIGIAAPLLLAAAPVKSNAAGPSSSTVDLALDVNVVAKQLDIARQSIQPSLGASVYDFARQAIATQPQGDNQPFHRPLLQAPGAAQDSFGQLHVLGDHANLQFRLNGVILPEGINVFGQVVQTRLTHRCR
jgi:hypothetical protein